jgi:hypothetical protein
VQISAADANAPDAQQRLAEREGGSGAAFVAEVAGLGAN